MATATQTLPALVTLEEYLRTKYRPDREFVDGHLEERTMGTPKYAMLQMQLGHWFISHQKQWKIRVMGDVRTKTIPTRVRLPDVAVVTEEAFALEELWIATPPLIAIEILSPKDRIKRVAARLEEYRVIGVQNIWLLDPMKRIAHIYTEDGLRQAINTLLTLPNSPIYLDLPELFAALD